MIHHIGKTALANSHRDEYEKVVKQVYNEGLDFDEAEQRQFGFDHAALGASVATIWKLPKRLITVIQYHHDAEGLVGLAEHDARLTALVTVTSRCLTRLGVGRSGPDADLDLTAMPAWQFLGLEDSDLDPILEIAEEQVKASQALIA